MFWKQIIKKIFSKPTAIRRNIYRRTDMEKVSQTGQLWSADDYRNVRFVNAKRWVNETFELALANPHPKIVVAERIISCDGGGVLGHPKIFINLDKPGPKYCFYCGKEYVKDKIKNKETKCI